MLTDGGSGGGPLGELSAPIELSKILKQQTITLLSFSKTILIVGIPVRHAMWDEGGEGLLTRSHTHPHR